LSTNKKQYYRRYCQQTRNNTTEGTTEGNNENSVDRFYIYRDNYPTVTKGGNEMKDVYEVDVELEGATYTVTYYFKEKEKEGVFNWLDPEGEEEVFEMMEVVPEVDGDVWRELEERVRGDILA